jgi:hypothetical protein
LPLRRVCRSLYNRTCRAFLHCCTRRSLSLLHLLHLLHLRFLLAGLHRLRYLNIIQRHICAVF